MLLTEIVKARAQLAELHVREPPELDVAFNILEMNTCTKNQVETRFMNMLGRAKNTQCQTHRTKLMCVAITTHETPPDAPGEMRRRSSEHDSVSLDQL